MPLREIRTQAYKLQNLPSLILTESCLVDFLWHPTPAGLISSVFPKRSSFLFSSSFQTCVVPPAEEPCWPPALEMTPAAAAGETLKQPGGNYLQKPK